MRKIPEILEPDEQDELLGALAPRRLFPAPQEIRDLAIIRLMLDTGLRSKEVREIKVKSINWTTGSLKVRGKGQKDRIVWIPESDRALLQQWLKVRPPSSNLLFTDLAGKKPLCGRWLRKLIKRVAEKAGLEKNIHLHTLRHTFATDLLRKTKNLRLVQRALGHSNIATTTIYTHITDEELETAMKELRDGR